MCGPRRPREWPAKILEGRIEGLNVRFRFSFSMHLALERLVVHKDTLKDAAEEAYLAFIRCA